jgi:BlaI family penicillinase repressor
MKAAPPRPTDAELEILTILWSRGPSTVRAVHEIIAGRKPTQYTTVLKTLQIMDQKGLVLRDQAQRAHIYQASQPCEATQRQLAGDLLQRAFGGSARSLMLGALSSRPASKQEIAELHQLLEDHEKRTS